VDGAEAEDSDALIAEALGHADRLEATIEELLALAPDVHADEASTDLRTALDELEAQWRERFALLDRRFDVRMGPGVARASISPPPCATSSTCSSPTPSTTGPGVSPSPPRPRLAVG
jgi:hypothetical protein